MINNQETNFIQLYMYVLTKDEQLTFFILFDDMEGISVRCRCNQILIFIMKWFVFLQFKFESCKFKVQKSKEGTGRIVMWNMGIMNSYTMEVST